MLTRLKQLSPSPAWALALQALLCLIAFNKLLNPASPYILASFGDGLKNYFTYLSYVRPVDGGGDWLKLYSMNYPYGDYAFFADNTPLLSWPLRFLQAYVVDLSPYLVFLHDLFFIAGLLLTTWYAHRLLSLFLDSPWVVLVLSLSLVWLNPQMPRLAQHYNLSAAWLLLGTAYYALVFYRGERVSWRVLGALWGLCLAAGLMHLYYLPILAFNLLGLSLGFYWGQRGRLVWAIKRSLGLYGAMAAAFLPLVLALRWMDAYKAIRPVGAEGYDWGPWKNATMALFTPHEWNSLGFILPTDYKVGFENNLYLGSFALYGSLAFLLLLLSRQISRSDLRLWLGERPLLGALLGTGLWVFIISLGERNYIWGEYGHFRNYLNPLLYLHWFSQQVEQFRCLGRFGWLFFWTYNIGLAYLLWRYALGQRSWVKGLLGALALGLLVWDSSDFIRAQNRSHPPNIFLAEKMPADLRQLMQEVSLADYQAILPIPAFHVGSENYNYTIDPSRQVFIESLQFAWQSGLPLMSSVMARTPLVHAQAYLSLYEAEPDSALLAQLRDKPVLVLVWLGYDRLDPVRPSPERPYALRIFEQGDLFLTQRPVELLAERGQWALYRWNTHLEE